MLRANVFHELQPIVGVRWAKATTAKHVSIANNNVFRIVSVSLNIMSADCLAIILFASQPHPEEGTGAPFVLVDNHNIIIEYGVVHHQGDSSKTA